MNARRLKIFISAYACEPEKGSEPGIGWNVVRAGQVTMKFMC